MKNLLILFIASSTFFIGCGGSGGTGGSGETDNQDVDMVVSGLYTAYPGNKIVKNTTNTTLKITHVDGEVASTIVLLEGNATIIRNP